LLLNESAFFSLLDYIIILVDLCLSISAKKLPSTTELDRGIESLKNVLEVFLFYRF